MVRRLLSEQQRVKLRLDAPLREKAADYVRTLEEFIANPAPSGVESVAALKVVAGAALWLVKKQIR